MLAETPESKNSKRSTKSLLLVSAEAKLLTPGLQKESESWPFMGLNLAGYFSSSPAR